MSYRHFRGKMVTLDVGGKLFKTALTIIASKKGTYFHRLFSRTGWEEEKDETGAIFFDRDGALFHYIIEYHRDGDLMNLPTDSKDLMLRIRREAQYYDVHGMVKLIDEALLNAERCQAISNPVGNDLQSAKLQLPVGQKVVLRFVHPKYSNGDTNTMSSYAPVDVEVDLKTLMGADESWFGEVFSTRAQIMELPRDEEGRFIIHREKHKAAAHVVIAMKEGMDHQRFLRCDCLASDLWEEAKYFNVQKVIKIADQEIRSSFKRKKKPPVFSDKR